MEYDQFFSFFFPSPAHIPPAVDFSTECTHARKHKKFLPEKQINTHEKIPDPLGAGTSLRTHPTPTVKKVVSGEEEPRKLTREGGSEGNGWFAE